MKTINLKFSTFILALVFCQLPYFSFSSSGLNNETNSVYIPDDRAEEFSISPITFVKRNVDIKKLIAPYSEDSNDFYQITFNCRKGYLEVITDNEGNILKTNRKFKDAHLPNDVRREIHSENQGYEVKSFVHMVSTYGTAVTKDVYKVKLQKGKKSKNYTLKR